MDGDGTLVLNGHILADCKGPVTDDDMEKDDGEWRLSYALHTARLEGHIPADCEYVLDAGGTFHEIRRA
jgi:hypothetical protein